MLLNINRDYFDNPTIPKLFLCQTNKEIIGELKAYSIKLNGKWNSYSTLEFAINRSYIDLVTGEHKIDPLFDLCEGLRVVKAEGIGYFQIQDPDTIYSDNETKTINCFSLEYATSKKYLENFYINTGSDESVEVTYWASQFGDDYWDQDNYYKRAGITFDAYTRYYIKDYTDNDSYNYTEVSISNATEFATYDASTVAKTLYVKSYPNVQFYNPTVPALSLLHIIMAKIPEWSIGDVDYSLRKQERKFEEERVSVYDFLMNNMVDTFKCVVEWDTDTNTVNFYEEAEDGITEDNTIQSDFDTNIYISRENLANEINIKYSTDNIKTKLKVSGGDDMDIRDVNIGQNYIMNLDYYHTPEWMGQELYSKYATYKQLVESTKDQYTEAMQRWVGAYNVWNDLVNAVPAEGNILLVGDPFEELYCTYVPVDDTDASKEAALSALTTWLDIYHVDDDTNGNKTDNVLLTLKDDSKNSTTIRVYYDSNDGYKVKRSVKNVSAGTTSNREYSLTQWINGTLTASYMDIDGYKIASIGTLGAYLCLTKDETVTSNLEDYGIKLLEEKQETYMMIFQTQTEELLSNEKYKCIASESVPTGEIPDGTRWLDTDSSPVKVYIRKVSDTSGEYSGWTLSNVPEDVPKYEDYVRYIDNYNKLQSVQEVLVEKQRIANLYLNGIKIEGVYLDWDSINQNANPFAKLRQVMRMAAEMYYGSNIVFDANFNLDGSKGNAFAFNITGDANAHIVYAQGNEIYTAYLNSQGASLAEMNYLKTITNMETYFTPGEWMRLSAFIREDEFSDSNVALTGYESEEERISLCNELVTLAEKELRTLSQPSLEFSMNMANILALPEFASIKNKFQLGNFIRIGLPNNMTKRVRLLECSIDFDDLSSFSCTFGNLITTKSEIDVHAELLSQAIQAGKTVASSANNWQKAVDKANSIDEAINGGLRNAALEVGSASNQSIRWDENGIWGRKLIEGTTDQYEPTQFRIINNKIVFSTDNFQTSKSVFGEFQYDSNGDGISETHFGVLAEALVGGYVQGSRIEGGSLKIGSGNTYFEVTENGDVSIKKNGQTAYADASVVAQIEESRQYRVELSYSNSTVFNAPNQSCIITAKVYKWDEDITSQLPNSTKYSWIRNSSSDDAQWNTNHANQSTNTITITNNDVNSSAQFLCQVNFDDTNL